ncbi:uncharacterized protein LOC126897408 [Daktulosphaira vitifoliae]|uniref:uncharacterized protein LOC126897408 n=1 Tax=Daktulosphaira vitifoliae TaxID=58002 RepID=UPI0021A995D1|nr:uncharacterized protein LOC126897408 [Daktulosphaira vitifoliae]
MQLTKNFNMKLFIANIILLVILQKCEKVLSSSDILEDETVLTDTNEQKNCQICRNKINVIDCKLPCCSGTFHKNCLDNWISYGVILCPNCYGNPLEDILICYNCRRTKNKEQLIKMQCCSKDLCKHCINYKMKTKCLCKKDLMKGITFDSVRVCFQCGKEQGTHTFSPRCPHIYCENCFITMDEDHNRCIYCDEKKMEE